MNIMADFSLFSLIILLYWVMTELFTILFRFTGLPDEKARFQVASLLTGCGYTTRESELFLSSKRRRKLARITMMFGYAFNITIVSAFVNVFLSMKASQIEHLYIGFMLPLVSISIIFICMRVPAVHAWSEGVLQRLAERIVDRDGGFNAVLLLDYIGTDTIAVVTLHSIPEQFRDIPLSETGLRTKTGILVMLVERAGQKPAAAGADTVFKTGDKLTVFGNYAVICKTFHAREHFGDT